MPLVSDTMINLPGFAFWVQSENIVFKLTAYLRIVFLSCIIEELRWCDDLTLMQLSEELSSKFCSFFVPFWLNMQITFPQCEKCFIIENLKVALSTMRVLYWENSNKAQCESCVFILNASSQHHLNFVDDKYEEDRSQEKTMVNQA